MFKSANKLMGLWIITILISGLICCRTDSKDTKLKKIKYKEAPQLSKLVKEGKLPPVEKRLPETPFVQDVYGEIGKYGGTIRMAWKGRDDKWGPGKCAEEYLIMYNADGTKVLPNLATWEISNNYKDYTFHLIKGIKWSDGEEFDVNDILFFWDHILIKEAIYGKSFPVWLKSPQTEVPAKFEKIDQYSFKIIFTESYPLFINMFCTEAKDFYVPEHYYKTILPEFIGEEKAKQTIIAEGYKDLKDYLNWKRYYWWVNHEIPSLRAWVAVTDNDEPHFIMKRNPYYWKIDKNGNQLPYIDELDFELIKDTAVINFKAMAGELDFQQRHIAVDNFQNLIENQQKGDYHVLQYREPGVRVAILPNQTCEDLVIRKLFQNLKFRAALSLSINRTEINNVIYKGLGKSSQAAIVEGAPYYSEQWTKQYIEYNPTKANQFLDQLGLTWDANKQYRLSEDGKRLDIRIDFDLSESHDIYAELIRKHWKIIGINAILKSHERSEYEKLRSANKLQIGLWDFDAFNFVIYPAAVIPAYNNEWYGLYGKYVQTKGKEGIKPEGDIAKILTYWNNILTAQSDSVIETNAKKIIDLHQKNIWIIGCVAGIGSLTVVKNNLKNVPPSLIESDVLRSPGNARFCQFYFNNP